MVRQARIYKIQRIQTLANELINEYLIREQALEDENAGEYATIGKTIFDMCNELLKGEVSDRKKWEERKPREVPVSAQGTDADGNELKRLARRHGVRLWEIAERLGCSEGTLTRKLRREVDPIIAKAIRQAIEDIISEENQKFAERQ